MRKEKTQQKIKRLMTLQWGDKESWTRDRWMRTFWHRQRHYNVFHLLLFSCLCSIIWCLSCQLQRSCHPFRGFFTLIRLRLDHPVERLFNVSRKTLSAAFPDAVLCAHIFLVLLEKVSACCWFACWRQHPNSQASNGCFYRVSEKYTFWNGKQ